MALNTRPRPPGSRTRTCGLICGDRDSQDTVSSLDVSAPQVRWICSGTVPDAWAAAVTAADEYPSGNTIAAATAAPAPVAASTKLRRDKTGVAGEFLDMNLTLIPAGELRATI